jgi:hypothetical protein
MRRAEHLHKTMTALRCCVEHCRKDPAPLAALEKNLQELRNSPDFSAADVAEIEALARRALAACSDQSVTTIGTSATDVAGAPNVNSARCA